MAAGLISEPVSHLVQTAKKTVTLIKDFAIRALYKYMDDELGLLTDSFNEMLSKSSAGTAICNITGRAWRNRSASAPPVQRVNL